MWGTGLGFLYMIAYTASATKLAWQPFNLHSVSLPLYFDTNPMNSKMFKGLGEKAWQLTRENFTF